jgi:hypothetical protein
MKKFLIAMTAVAALFVGSQAWACLWDGYWGGPMGAPVNGYYSNIYSSGTHQGFFDGTVQLRQNLAEKRSEYQALLAQPNPDPRKVSDLNRQITMLNDQLVAEARSSNLPIPSGNYGNSGNGPMWGSGMCW